MDPVKNHETYCGAMEGSLTQKLFFVKHLPKLDYLLDYGCADGSLLRSLHQNNPWGNPVLLGYDQDAGMIERADAAALFLHRGPLFVDQEQHALSNLTLATKKGDLTTGVLLSSVLHEMYSQLAGWKMLNFWSRLAATGVEYIIIRDMYWDANQPFRDDSLASAAWAGRPEQAKEFQSWLCCGESLADTDNAVEFLLKYPYVENWERELEEDYFSIPASMRNRLVHLGYEPMLWEHHGVPFIQERIKQDFGIDMLYPTHVKAIFKRK